ncbi:WD40-like Beta Propeller Repeat [Loktanella fryxellensis]|uniref:WD40-like Beta Propeller Repeat n=1 Tax=Loktanella fryxellensis TaxID=245187 RepID=A0A1H7ZXG5_9RHOB|nr:PD40 domain-containing protein [Loktanella fryxellensis]SEM63160.1 WD40-like Beta Propeller Repeat [Loktanella fryxellensis]
MRSSLEIYDMATGDVRVVWQTDALIEAPNWHPDGWLLVNRDGRLLRVGLDGTVAEIDIGFADACNNDHGISADGRWIWLSHHVDKLSTLYRVPVGGGVPEQVVPDVPSYWHGVDRYGVIAYCARRGGRYEVCTWDGAERQLTGVGSDEGHNDGPDFSADGAWIWFNSDRSGAAQIWRMRRCGTDVQRMVVSDTVDWFPHPSPDGAHVLYLAYPAGTLYHPRDLTVQLRVMPQDGGDSRAVLDLFGGQGSINVPCWSPDGASFAYVRYAPVLIDDGVD